MGSKAPKTFNMKDDFVAMRGMLPEISQDSSERVVRAQIVKNCDEAYDKCMFTE